MSSTHASLDAAANERKLRLAKLKSLKRKQPDPSTEDSTLESSTNHTNGVPKSSSPPSDVTSTYLSGRNYDPEARGPKLGFESAPTANQITLEDQATTIASSTKAVADDEAKADKPIDLFQLQPKKPNWDLKRDLGRKMEVLNVRTENAIARLVRERISNAQRNARASEKAGDEGEVVGIEGSTLVEGVHVREREEEEDERREREDEGIA
ncbi:MAG: hypothetical protein M1836_001576 [Candelina mexicana]|nr:MAG: hypothetical protein M1836_001576 [Candelina mexicana]